MMSKIWIAGWLLLLAGCSGASDPSDAAVEPVALVTLASVVQGGSAQQITLYGIAEPGPMGKLSLVAPAEARVVAIDAPTGTRVAPGQVIVRLAPSPVMRADAAKAASDAVAAQSALARAQRLRSDGLASDAEVETARAAAVSADALHASFASRAAGLTVRAPTAGTVDGVVVAPGELLQIGAAIASVTGAGDGRARFGIDPEMARRIRPGMTLQLAGRRGGAPLTIETVSPVVDPQTRLAAIFAKIPAGSGVSVGEPLTATIALADNGAGQSVPYAALLDDAGQAYVYVVANGVAHRRDVAVQTSSGPLVTVTKGLRAGERVVIEGGTAIEDGMKVRTQ